MIKSILLSGFGGQGILFSGRVLANAGLIGGYNVTWLPSYGPETRGGTSNCSVVISDRAIGSPLVTEPDILIAMNTPAYDKFIGAVAAGGSVIMDSSLIDRGCSRSDVTEYKLPATEMADADNLGGLSSMILLGKLFGVLGIFDGATVADAVKRSISAKRPDLAERNMEAIRMGENGVDR